jgi:O-acetyl-ADP-ribose deacetylase (regulator of RNase III)
MPFTIDRQDITKIKVDVIVTIANTDLQISGGGVLAFMISFVALNII